MNLEQLIKKCIKKDRRAQEILYNTYRKKLFPVCLKYCRSKSEAEDHLHDVFIEIFDNIRTYSGKGSFEGWMKRIAIYKAIDKFKNNKNVALQDSTMQGLTEDTSIMESEMPLPIELLMRYIQELPQQYNLIFNLYELDDFTHKEIAKILNISEGTSKSNLHRAKALLKSRIISNSENRAKKSDIYGK